MEALGHIAPFFIVSDVRRAIEFYQRLGFEPRTVVPEHEPFFAIVGRDSVHLYLKDVSDESQTVQPQPNHTRHEWVPWDAFVFVPDPDGLAAEFTSRGVEFKQGLQDRDDGIRGFSIGDSDGYVLFFGRPI